MSEPSPRPADDIASLPHAPSPLRGGEPSLPPGFSCLTLSPGADAFAEAIARAADLGAASVLWVARSDLLEFAVVLEPEEPLGTARLAHYMAMNALADMVAVHGPPERPLRFGWPDALLMDHGLIGGGRLAWPHGCAESAVPAWLVFGAMVRLAAPSLDEARDFSAGAGISLAEIGADPLDTGAMLESFCRHLMLASDEWQAKGAKAVVKRWLDRLEPQQGVKRGVEPHGDLVSRSKEGETRAGFVQALAAASWFDAARRAPRL